MQRISASMDPPGELLATTTCANIKNLIVGALELRGPLDPDAMREAIRRTGDAFPRFKMCVKEVRKGYRHYLVWDHEPGLEIPLVIWDVSNTNLGKPSLDLLLNCLEPSLERQRDLSKEPPAEVHLVKLAQDHHILASVIHHVAADAITFAESTRELMIKYHEIVTGQEPTFSSFPLAASAVRKRAIPKKKTVWRDYWTTFRQALIPYKSRCALPGGSGVPNACEEHHVKRLLSEEETEQVVAESLKRRASLVDYLLADVSIAIDRWNKAGNTESSNVTAALTVNMDGRFADVDGPNNDSILYFQCSPEQRMDAKVLGRSILLSRIRLFRNQTDRKYYKAIGKFNNFFRVLPFKRRQQVFLQLLQRHQTSFALGFMGVLWPEADERKITGDSYLTSAGGLTITEVHGLAYKLVSRTPLYLSAYVFRKRLNLILSAAGRHFTRDEAQAFLDLVIDLLIPQAVSASR